RDAEQIIKGPAKVSEDLRTMDGQLEAPRMDTSRKSLWPKVVATAVVVLPVLYVASFGPVCWLVGHGKMNSAIPGRIYRPLYSRYSVGAIFWYGNLWDQSGARLLAEEWKWESL